MMHGVRLQRYKGKAVTL